MNTTQNDLKEATHLAALQQKIDHIDANYVDATSTEIFQRQPFFLTVLLGYRLDTTPPELEEIMKIYFLIWEYFRPNKQVPTKKVTESDFETVQDKFIQIMQEGNLKQTLQAGTLSMESQNLRSKALLTAVLFRYNNEPVLRTMDEAKRGIVLVGIMSFIKCFETV